LWNNFGLGVGPVPLTLNSLNSRQNFAATSFQDRILKQLFYSADHKTVGVTFGGEHHGKMINHSHAKDHRSKAQSRQEILIFAEGSG